MPSLKTDNLRLYRSVKLQVYLHLILGLALLFLPSAPPSPNSSPLGTAVGGFLIGFGVVYLVVAGVMAIGVFWSKKNYRLTRLSMGLAAAYSTFWAVLLMGILGQALNRSIAYIAVMFWYISYTQWYLFIDPGWKAINIVNKVLETTDGHNQRTIE